MHWLGHERVREGAQFPVAEMSGGEQDAAPGLLRFEVMLKAFVTDQLMNVLGIDFGEACEDPDEPCDGAEDFICDGPALGRGFLRIREFEVAHRGAA